MTAAFACVYVHAAVRHRKAGVDTEGSMETSERRRLGYIDTARGVGLVLVFYGHFVEQLLYLGNAVAGVHYKWIYSFHMVLFFVLSGWIRGMRPPNADNRSFLVATLAGRVVPYFFFSLLLALASLLITGWFPAADLSTVEGYAVSAVSTVLGFPLFNIPLWFVACLVSVECLHHVLRRFLDTPVRILLVAVFSYVAGYALNHQYFFFGHKLSFWLVHEVPVVYAFYLVGTLLGRARAMRDTSVTLALVVFAACLALVHLTYDLNQGPFRYLQAVLIVLSGHGHFLWFPFTALAGTFMVVFLGKALAGVGALSFLGRNGLLFLGMNGVFYHFVNKPVAAWLGGIVPAQGWAVFAAGAAVTGASLALCVPLVFFMNRAFPQLVGKPRSKGAFFGPLLGSASEEAHGERVS